MFVSPLVVTPLCSHHCSLSSGFALSIIFPSHISFPTHFLSLSLHCCFSSGSKHQSNAQWVIWFSSQTYISRSNAPSGCLGGLGSGMSAKDSSQAAFQITDGYWSTDCCKRSFAQVLLKPVRQPICHLYHKSVVYPVLQCMRGCSLLLTWLTLKARLIKWFKAATRK